LASRLAPRALVAYTYLHERGAASTGLQQPPLGALYEERLVEDLLLLVDVVRACRDGDDARLCELGVSPAMAID